MPSYLFILLTLICRVNASNLPLIESIEGDQTVVVKTPEGHRVASRGATVEFGDRIKTGPKASAKIRYPDGSKLLIGRGSEVEVQAPADETQKAELVRGEVRGIVRKPKGLRRSGPPKFIVRSRVAVMGVRGTDFVFNLNSTGTESQVHTLDGLVEVAHSESALVGGKGILVPKNQFTSADANQVAQPQAFDRVQYLQSLHHAQPEFTELIRNDPEAVSDSHFIPPESLKDDDRPWLRLLNFQMSGIYIRQKKTGGELISSQISWNPEFELFWPITIRGHLGVFPIKNRNTNDKEIASEIVLTLALRFFDPLLFEAGIGGGSWGKEAGAGHLGMMNVAYVRGENSFLQRIFVGTTRFQFDQESDNPATVFKAGIGIQF